MNRFYDTERNNINDLLEQQNEYELATATCNDESALSEPNQPDSLQAAIDNLDQQLQGLYAALWDGLMTLLSVPFRYPALFVSSYLLLVIIIAAYQAFFR